MAYQKELFWDGRAADLSIQARSPLTNPSEHGLADDAALVRIIRGDPNYTETFFRAFGVSTADIDSKYIFDALASYERTLIAGGSLFDRYQYANETSALSPEAVRGLALFRGRAGCASCHPIGERFSLLTDHAFHMSPTSLPPEVTRNLSTLARKIADPSHRLSSAEIDSLVASDESVAALGRFIVTLNASDIGKFKTPSLRNVALTAPYMHDGSVSTLEEAVDLELYSRGGKVSYPIILTLAERQDLIRFLEALTSPFITQ